MSSTSHRQRSPSPAFSPPSPRIDDTKTVASSSSTSPRRPSVSKNELQHAEQGLGVEDSAASENSKKDKEANQRRVRSSRFLLERPSWSDAGNVRRSTHHAAASKKGKEVSLDPGLNPHSQRHLSSSHRPRQSIGKSPLAVEIVNAPSHDDGHNKDLDDGLRPGASDLSRDPGRHAAKASLGGLGTDPTQIVNLALSLSETRRRQMHAGGLNSALLAKSSAIYPAGPRAGSLTQSAPRTNSPSLLAKPREHSGNHTPKVNGGFTPQNAKTASSSPVSLGGGVLNSPVMAIWDLESVRRATIFPSDSTKARVAKAKQYLELMALYHELLQQLPPLPTARSDRHGTSQNDGGNPAGSNDRLGRAYSPLQYIRNRRARAHRSSSTNAEVEGWADVEKVREWVAKVAGNARQKLRTNEVSRLPDFEILSSGFSAPSTPAKVASEGHRQQHSTRMTRPRVDWQVTPWDLLADAYWVDQADHKWLIEDRKGRKIHGTKPGPIGRTNSVQENSIPLASQTSSSQSRRPDSRSRNTSDLDRQTEVADVESHRGRPRPRDREPTVKASDHDSSQDRKPKWPSKFMRSQSSSSSEESRLESLAHPPLLRPRQTSRDRQDSRILEKQVNNLLSTQRLDDAPNRLDGSSDAAQKPDAVGAELTTVPQIEDSDEDPGGRKLRRDDHAQQRLSTFHRSRSSFETDESTAPNSPDSRLHVPSIAIKLSPPRNRKLSKLLSNNTLQRLSISDHKPNTGHPTEARNHSIEGRSHIKLEQRTWKPTSANDGFLSPKSAENIRRSLHRPADIRPSQDRRGFKEPDGKRKGVVKPSRIAGLVSNPVYRVGDLIRRKEAVESSELTSPISTRLSDGSMSDEEQESVVRDRRKRSEENLSVSSSEHRNVSTGPRYHTSNLPVFRSPFRENSHERSASNERSPDSIHHQPSRHHDRSNRFHRFGSLGFRTKSNSPVSFAHPTTPPDMEGDALPEQQESRQHQRRFAVVRTSSGGAGQPYPMATSTYPNPLPLAGENGMSFPNLQIGSLTDPGHRRVEARDVLFIETLVTATNVISNLHSRTLRWAASAYSRRTPHVQPQECITAKFDLANGEIASIKRTTDEIREDANRLSNVVVSGLHESIRALDARISSQLTSEVRALADGADALGVQLGTNCTLEVKRLNDRIDQIMRRRRRQFRWLRRSGYLLLEWTLLATMWWVWLIVVIFRLVRSIVQGMYRTVRWLLWL